MRAMKDSGVEWIGEIPSDWATRRVKTVATNSQEKDNYHGEAYIGLENIESWTGKYVDATSETATQVDSVVASYSEKSVLFGKLRPYLAKVFRPYNSGQCSTEILVLNPYDVSRDFLFWNMVSGAFIDEVNSSTYGAKMPRANWEFIGTSHIPYPTDTEQSRIASFLDAKCAQIDAIIEKQRQVIEKLKAYKQSVITEVVTKGLDPSVPMKDSGVEWIGMVPEGWSIPKINYCFTSIGSGTTPSSDDESFYNGPIYWIQSGDINGGVLTTTQKTITEQAYANYSALRIHKQPFIVVAMYGASIGNPSLSTIDACTNQACCVLGGSQNNIDFMFYVMVAAKAALVYSGKGGTQPNISQDIIKKLRIPQPTPLEQVHIAEYLREKCYVIEKTLEKKLSVIDKLTDYKKSLIYEAVTGKMEV